MNDQGGVKQWNVELDRPLNTVRLEQEETAEHILDIHAEHSNY